MECNYGWALNLLVTKLDYSNNGASFEIGEKKVMFSATK
jgi:hypothetical protein